MEDLANLPFDLNFNISSLIASLVFGLIGWYVFKRGRKDANNRLVAIGVIMMLYPYFVSGAIWNWGIGVVLCEGAYYYWDYPL